ncbi:hypothetical protein [Agrobacterium sp. ST15.13.015]|uniref:hypothetical protein n=1 Tax=Agrobacterium sp. ST15.13.015 TaxID=3017319 RepID=UPI0022C32868|nr:hypothetical protein [Agrobacterium sp. ST15.13.015]MCZ7501233.1 hypothetical protein [Rhizobium rhizogenes]
MRSSALIAIAALAIFPAASFAQATRFQKADCSTSLDHTVCMAQTKQMASDWKRANNGDYGSQRNVAFCLKNGCDGSTKIDAVGACSWRMIIQAAENEKDAADRWSYEADCKPLTNSDRRTAINQAEKIYSRIYGKQMPIERLLRD